MDTTIRKRPGKRPAATLFDDVRQGDRDHEFRERVRRFAGEVAKRHRREPGDLNAMLAALRAWHRTWTICARNRVPPLDDALLSAAIAAYEGTTRHRRHPAA